MLYTRINAISVAILALALAGCGGGGGDDDEQQPTTFTVGINVTGLSGGTLTLRLNGANDLTVGSAGTYTFPTQLANGTAYTVTVAFQPGTQVCGPGVANGTGTIAGANVSNLSIACGPFTIGGTITGLTAAGLVLQLNSGNDLTVPQNSTSFNFPSSVSLGGAILYQTRIRTQPAGQTCTIVDSTGVVSVFAATISSIKVACVANVTDPLSGTYRIAADDGEAIAEPAFLTLYPDGTFILGRHGEDSVDECGPSRGNGLQYGVYRWTRATGAFTAVTEALNSIGNCGLDIGHTSTVVVGANGTLVSVDAGENPGEEALLVPVTSTAGTIVGSWGDNQAFAVFGTDGRFMLVTTRTILQSPTTTPGIESGCYTVTSGTASAGGFAVDLGATCLIEGAPAIDTNGTIGLSQHVGQTLNFTVTGDTMTTTVNGGNTFAYSGIVPGVRRVAATPAALSFTVSGTISGLTSTGLGLRLNGQTAAEFNVSPAAGAMSFQFPALVPAGTPYSVMLSSVPTNATTQLCGVSTAATGTVTVANVTNVGVTCTNTSPYTMGGTVAGVGGMGLLLQVAHSVIGAGTTITTHDQVIAAGASSYQLPPGTIGASALFVAGILTPPVGQTCTLIRGVGFSIAAPVSGVNVACTNNASSPLGGTYSVLDAGRRWYFNFNVDGSFTTAMRHDGDDCNTPGDPDNFGNGVEYGVYNWNQATGRLLLPIAAVVDTNGSCGFSSLGPGAGDTLFVTKTGTTLTAREGAANGPVVATLLPVESEPGTLVGGFAGQASSGDFFVFHADGTFVFADVQWSPAYPLGHGQERGCYSASGGLVTFTIGPNCRPDGAASYDLNGGVGVFPIGVQTVTVPFAFSDPNTLRLTGRLLKRTAPN